MGSTLKVKGMSCQHCVMSVKKALDQLDGVQNVEVDLKKGEVRSTPRNLFRTIGIERRLQRPALRWCGHSRFFDDRHLAFSGAPRA